jgi:ATP-dependent DNA ligase
MLVPGAKIPLPPGFIAPCLPTPSQKPPSGSAWVHEIKHDGYRMIARRDGNRVRLFTRRGYDWSAKYPRIVEALRSLRVHSIIWTGKRFGQERTGNRIELVRQGTCLSSL